MSSFLAEANTSKSATATIPPSSIVNEISYYDTLPVFVNYQTSAVKFPLTSSANYPYLQVSVKTLTELQVIFQQSVNDTLDSLGEPATPVGSRYEIVPAMNVPGDPTLLDTQTPSKMLYYEVTSPFFRLVVVNRSETQVGNLLLTTKLASSRPTDGLIQMDNILVGGLNPSSQPTLFKTDAEGRLKVDASITIEDITLSPESDGVKVFGSFNGTTPLVIKTDTSGKLDVVVSSAMKARDYTDNSIRDVACDASGNLKINVTIDDLSPTDDGVLTYGSFNGTTPLVIKTDADGKLDVILDQTKVGETGNQFIFVPTAANNTIAIYADGAVGTNVTGGWRYTNNPAATLKKINWYVYQSPLAETSYEVSQLENIYCVINNITTSNKLPFFAFYTRATGSGDAASWYKSRIILSASNTTGTGVKFLYTGEDPVLIHPEITGANRIQLVWDPISSTKTLEQAKDENIFTSTLQTDSSTSVAGSFDFVFQEYGIVWEKTKVFLPVEFGKLQVSVGNFPVTQPVSGTIAVSNFPAPVTSVAVNNLAPIELKLDENNVYLQGISVTTSGIRNSLNWTPRQLIIISTPTTITAGAVVTNTEYPLEALNNTEVKYKNAIYLGSVNASVNTNPKLVFQYSDDETNWFSDGVSASFYKPAGGSTTWEFAFQRSGLGVKYIRLVAQTTTTINYLALNLSV